MASRDIPVQLRQKVIERSGSRCEYCRMPDHLSFYPPEIDHIVARKHGGETTFENLARICWRCNRYKGTDIASLDPLTHTLTRLFNPRVDLWMDHFRINGVHLQSDTPVGRTTIFLLQLDSRVRVEERTLALAVGQYP